MSYHHFKSMFFIILCFSPLWLSAQNIDTAPTPVQLELNTPPKPEYKETQLLNYSIGFGLGYQSFTYYDKKHNTAMESFITLSMLATYYPLPFLALSYHFGLDMLSYYNIDHLDNDGLKFFPANVTRFNIENTISAEFFGFINKDSLIYFSIGPTHIYMAKLNKENVNDKPNNFKGTNQNLLYMKAGLGSRFALYDHTLMDVQVYIMKRFENMNSWANLGEKTYKQIVFGFEMNFAYFD